METAVVAGPDAQGRDFRRGSGRCPLPPDSQWSFVGRQAGVQNWTGCASSSVTFPSTKLGPGNQTHSARSPVHLSGAPPPVEGPRGILQACF